MATLLFINQKKEKGDNYLIQTNDTEWKKCLKLKGETEGGMSKGEEKDHKILIQTFIIEYMHGKKEWKRVK